MLKVIDLDAQGKDGEGLVFTLTINNEKFGITDQEMAELIRSKHSMGNKATKRAPQRRGAAAMESQASENIAEVIPEAETEEAAAEATH